jgi:hypothetical protein
MATDSITYKQLEKVLLQLGFSRQRVEPRWLRYEHTDSDTVIVLPEKRPDEIVRVTDVVSACRHLVEKGLVSATEIEALLSRKATPPKTPSAKKR